MAAFGGYFLVVSVINTNPNTIKIIDSNSKSVISESFPETNRLIGSLDSHYKLPNPTRQ